MKKKNIARYFTILRGVKLPWIVIILCFASSIVMMSAQIQVATLTASIIDTSQNAINGKVLTSYIAMVLVTAAFTICENYFTRRMEETINLRVRTKLWDKIMHLPTRYYDVDNGDELVTRITSDAEALSSLFSMAVSFVTCVITTIQAFLQLFQYNTMLATYSLLIIPITLVLCIVYSKLTFRLGVYSTKVTASSMAYLAERVRNFRLMKSVAAEKLEAAKGSRSFGKLYLAEFLSWLLVAGYQLVSSLFSILFIVIIFVIGGQLIPSGEVTIGDLTGFYMITGIVGLQLMQCFMNVGSESGTFGTMKKIAEIADMPPEAEAGQSVTLVCRDIVFDHVSFSYQEGQEVLRDVSVRIPMGKVTAIIGGNGAGKSTMFKLIERLYAPNAGAVRFGDEDIQDYQLADWRDHFSYVSQKSPLIGGTVRENITYGLSQPVSDERLYDVAKKANCYDFVMKKPGGFEEDVGLGGSNFSGGQGQCISIARAMLRGGDYLLLDEATSNLDVVSEAMVTEAMDRLMQNKTTSMIAHNYAATKNADYIIVMRDGTVEAPGTPEELRETNEYYRMFCKNL